METAEIRRRWLSFFESKGHAVVPSSPLLLRRPEPAVRQRRHGAVQALLPRPGDPPVEARHVSVQKCVRTGDIEEVGKTSRHGTFFQMNGNFSFGDYFKEDAIRFAWELLDRRPGAGRLRPGPGASSGRPSTTTTTRRRSCGCELTDIPAERIVRRGKADNFWSMGVPGPCGPCSEIFYDRGPEYGAEGGPAVDEDRYMEIWNLVFMQNDPGRGQHQGRLRRSSATCRPRTSTPAWAWSGSPSVLQGVDNLYEIDEVYPVLEPRPPSWRASATAPNSGHDAAHEPPRRRAAARRRRPRAHLADAHRRRRHPRQRGPRLRAAPDAAPRRPLDAPARRRRAVPAPAAAGQHGADEAVLPRAARPASAGSARSPTPRRRRSGAPSRPGTTILDTAVARGEAVRRSAAGRATRRSRCTTPTASRST